MWSTYIEDKKKLSGKGYSKGFITYNERATNKYKDRTCLVYTVNPYMNVGKKMYFQNNGIDVKEDLWALSTAIQWIWRSAIREGSSIDIYIPSSRLRTLLFQWMDCLEEGGNIVNELYV